MRTLGILRCSGTRMLFTIAVAASMLAAMAPAASARADEQDDFAAAFLAAPLSNSGSVFARLSSDPITLSLPTWANDYRFGEGHGYAGWGKSVDSPNPDGYLLETSYGDVPGLAIGLTGEMEYRPGGATWSYAAPGTTRIASANLNLSYRDKLFAHHCLGLGLRNAEGNRHLVEHCNPPEPDAQSSYDVALEDPSSEPTSKQAFFQLRMPVCNNPDDIPCSKWIPSLDLIKNGPLATLHRVEMVLVDDDLPVVTPSGPFYDLDGKYIDGRQSYDLRVDASDAGAGIKQVDIDHLNNPKLANKDSACDPTHNTPELGSRICPPEDQIEMTVDTNPMPEGTRRFDANATDPAENVGYAPWTVIIDRTPPPAPNLRFLKPEEGSAQVEWDEAVDPVLPDGTPGSGTTWYRYRYQINGGDWSDWHEIPASRRISNEVYDQPIGTEVWFEVQAIDLVRNESESSYVGGDGDGDRATFTLDGELYSRRDGHFSGSATSSITFTAHEPEIGLRLVEAKLDESRVAVTEPACIPANQPLAPGKKVCPSSAAVIADVDMASLPEGSHTIRGGALDRAGNHGVSPAIRFFVDKTPPIPPSSIDADLEDGEILLRWDPTEDPRLADGFSGSGRSHDSVGIVRGDGSRTDWYVVRGSSLVLPARDSGEILSVEVRTADKVGNESSTRTIELQVTEDSVEEDDVLNDESPPGSVVASPASAAPCGIGQAGSSGTNNLWIRGVELSQGISGENLKVAGSSRREGTDVPSLAYSELTKSTYNETDYVPRLVKGRPTVARVYVVRKGDQAGAVVRLYGYSQKSGRPLPGSPLKPLEGQPDVAPDETSDVIALRRGARCSWNFDLPKSWTTKRIKLTARVRESDTPECSSCDDGANRMRVRYVSFRGFLSTENPAEAAPQGEITFAEAIVRAGGQTRPSGFPQPIQYANDANKMFPVPAQFFASRLLAGQPTFSDISGCSEALRLYREWLAQRVRGFQAIVDMETYPRGIELPRFIAFVNEGDLAHAERGCADVGGPVGVSVANSSTVMHELAHMISGQYHSSMPGLRAGGWPHGDDGDLFGFGLLGIRTNFDLSSDPDAIAGASRGGDASDVLSYNPRRWISPIVWNEMLDGMIYNPVVAAGPFSEPTQQASASSRPSSEPRLRIVGSASGEPRLMSVAAEVVTRGEAVANPSIDPLVEILGVESRSTNGGYEIRVYGKGGELLNSVRTAPRMISDGSVQIHASVLFPPEAHSVSIWENDVKIAERVASSNVPAVRFTAPTGGERWTPGQKYAVGWTIEDADGETKEQKVFGGYRGTRTGPFNVTSLVGRGSGEYLLEAAELIPSTSGQLQIVVTDGFHTAIARSPRFIVEPEPISEARITPMPRRVSGRRPLKLTAEVIDPNTDPMVPVTGRKAIRWFVGRRLVGRGARLKTRYFIGKSGVHTIKVRVTASHGVKAVLTHRFRVVRGRSR